jgi:hypothetical protein
MTPTPAIIGIISNIEQKGLLPPVHAYTPEEAEKCLVLSNNMPGPPLSSVLADVAKFLAYYPTEVCWL